MIHSNNQDDQQGVLDDAYTDGELIRHRWWFPESTYRELTLGKFIRSFGDRDAWRNAVDYFLFREGVRDRIGSKDAYVYFEQSLPQNFNSVNAIGFGMKTHFVIQHLIGTPMNVLGSSSFNRNLPLRVNLAP